MTKLLIDTNIIIGLEDDGEIGARFATLRRKCEEFKLDIFVHEASREDVARDKNDARRRATLSKLDKFQILTKVAVPDVLELQKKYGTVKKDNDLVDIKMLDAVASDVVDLLITEDDGLHRRARAAGLADRVLTVADALVWIEQTYEPDQVFLPSVQSVKAYGINFNDPIFESIRADYVDFDKWTAKCKNEHRECWVILDNKAIAGLIIRKDELHNDAGTKHPGPKILKICTFKVSDRHRGQKLGEQLLKQALWHAQRNSYDLVYLTTYPQQQSLARLLEEYGFTKTIDLPNGEHVYEKPIEHGQVRLVANENALAAARRCYPRFVDTNEVDKFVIPIRPPYVAKLFPEVAQNRNAQVSRPGNTIRKVYLCHSASTRLKAGDLIFFYETKSNAPTSQSLISLGVVESMRVTQDLNQLKSWTAKRSVFSDAELHDLVSHGPVKVIDFLLIGHMGPSIGIDQLRFEGILNSWPQSIVKLPESRYRKLKPLINLGFTF